MHITVQGAHSVSVTPERATLHLSVVTEAATRERAIRDTTETTNDLAEQLGDLAGVESHTVSPLRVHSWRPSDQSGRRLTERVTAEVALMAVFTDFEQLSVFTSAAGARAGVQLGWVGWTVTDATRDRLEADVVAEAIRKARRRALAIAAADGGGDVEIVEVADPGLLGGGDAVPVPGGGQNFKAMALAGGDEASGPNIVPEDVEVTEAVHVRFRVVEQAPRGHRSQ